MTLPEFEERVQQFADEIQQECLGTGDIVDFWPQIELDNDGQIVIYTGITECEDGQIVAFTSHEDE